jgi:hypothetical protein
VDGLRDFFENVRHIWWSPGGCWASSGYSLPSSTVRPHGSVSAELMCHSVFQQPWTPRQVLLVRLSRSHRRLGIVLRPRWSPLVCLFPYAVSSPSCITHVCRTVQGVLMKRMTSVWSMGVCAWYRQQQDTCHMCCYHLKQYVAHAFPCKTTILDKAMVAKLDNKFLPLTGIEGSLPCSQQLAIGLYSEPYISSICHTLDLI